MIVEDLTELNFNVSLIYSCLRVKITGKTENDRVEPVFRVEKNIFVSIVFEILKKTVVFINACKMIISVKFASVLITLTLAVSNQAKPVNDFVFRDDDDVDVPALGLFDENQLLLDQTKQLNDPNENVNEGLEHGKYFQGDIVLVQDQKEYLLSNSSNFPTRTGWIDESYRWPKDSNGDVLLPFEISKNSGYSMMLNTFKS